MDKRLGVGIKAITAAGDYLRGQFLKKHCVSLKKDKTILLGEDLQSEEILLSTISKAFPQDSFLTEETDTTITTDTIWVFDPLCGSYSYLRGVETWSISSAFIADNKFQLGIVYQPYTQNLYFSELGKGAFMNKQKTILQVLPK